LDQAKVLDTQQWLNERKEKVSFADANNIRNYKVNYTDNPAKKK
jgi:hypothetical protein